MRCRSNFFNMNQNSRSSHTQQLLRLFFTLHLLIILLQTEQSSVRIHLLHG